MAEKYTLEKSRLRDYLIARGVKYDDKKKTWQCPGHQDEHPSAVLYENNNKTGLPSLYCPVCAQNWSVFEVAGLLDNLSEFKDKLKSVRDTLGIQPPKPPEKKPVALSIDAARQVYTSDAVLKLLDEKIPGKIAGQWPYPTPTGDIIGIDIRIEGDGKKTVLTFWYDGRSLRYAKAPVLIYNLPEIIKSDKPILINEGAKCAEAARVLTGFTVCTWSGGSAKAHIADWLYLKNKEVFIFRDDDLPGLKAAIEIQKQLPQAKIIKPIPEARAIKAKGADIEEALKVKDVDALTAYILNPENIETLDPGPEQSPLNPPKAEEPPPPRSGPVSEDLMPFKVLGIGDDGRAAFISEAGRLLKYNLDTLAKSKLLVLASRDFWRAEYSGRDGARIMWDEATDDIIRLSQDRDFNDADIRGRGAWKDGDKISYHDGVKTHGEYDRHKIYLRLPRHDIGITEKSAGADLCTAVKNTVFKLSFETPADAVRALGWSVLAPFAGALKFRPAILLTGPSGSGKTTVTNLVIRRLADCEWFNGSESTVAGVRGKIKYDSRGVMFEETESDTFKKATNRNELFSLMRVNVSDDAPDTVKGTKEGGFNSYKMQNMFGFIAIDPTIESVADENRIFRINMARPTNGDDWKKIEETIKNLLNDNNCRAIRALTWNKLKIILSLADRIVDVIRAKTGRDYRSSYADAMLSSAFMVIWAGVEAPADAQIENMLSKYYKFQPAEEHRDEAAEFVDKIMEEQIEILHEGRREKISILEGINRVLYGVKGIEGDESFYTETMINEYRLALSRHGVRCDGKGIDPGCIAIANNHEKIKKITGYATGYNRIFQRHKCFLDGNKTVYFLGEKNKKATIFKGLIEKHEREAINTGKQKDEEEFDWQN